MVMDFQPTYVFTNSNLPDVQNTLANPWIQVPPTTMPWTKDNRPDLVRFGESSIDRDSWNLNQPSCRFTKRKSDIEFDLKPAKMHITEEKMAAQLRDMHISNSYVNNQGFSDSLDDNECLLPTLVLSKEVQNLPTFQESILPEALLPKYEKPTRALVLWRPPAGSVSPHLISRTKAEPEPESEDKVDSTNNNTVTATPGFSRTFTDMEL